MSVEMTIQQIRHLFLTFQDTLSNVISEINSLNLEVKCFIADAPQRAKLRNQVQHNGYMVIINLCYIINLFY